LDDWAGAADSTCLLVGVWSAAFVLVENFGVRTPAGRVFHPTVTAHFCPFFFRAGFVLSYCRAWWHWQMQPSSSHSAHVVSARVTVPQCSQLFDIVDLFGYPLGDWGGYAVATHFVAGRVAVRFAVSSVEGVVVWPSHESFALDWCQSAYLHFIPFDWN